MRRREKRAAVRRLNKFGKEPKVYVFTGRCTDYIRLDKDDVVVEEALVGREAREGGEAESVGLVWSRRGRLWSASSSRTLRPFFS